MDFTEYRRNILLGENYSSDENYIDAKVEADRDTLVKILNIVFAEDFIKHYSRNDLQEEYWINPKDVSNMKKYYTEDEARISEMINSLTKQLADEENKLKHKRIKEHILRLKKRLDEIRRREAVLENWEMGSEEATKEDVMKILVNAKVLSPMKNIQQNTADLFTYMLNIKAFERVKKDMDPCVILGQISLQDRKELAHKILAACQDDNFGQYIDRVIAYRKQASFITEISGIIKSNMKGDDLKDGDLEDSVLFPILYRIMCPNKYMLLRDAYVILSGEQYYTDVDAYNMLNNNKKSYADLSEFKHWKKNELQLSWIYKLINSRIDNGNYDPLDDMPEDLKKNFDRFFK